jgi:hypothetical protein
MIRRLLVLVPLLVVVAASGSTGVTRPMSQQDCVQDHASWVGRTLEQMETIKPGMTRAELLKQFTTEGGLHTGLQRTFVSRDCPYFKVDVEFEAVGRSDHDGDGRATTEEDDRDVIVKISQPHVQFAVSD